MSSSSAPFTVDEIIRIKKAALLATFPFFGILISYLKSEGHPASWFEERGLCPTMATDGVRLLYCDEFVLAPPAGSRPRPPGRRTRARNTPCGLGHVWRRQHREPLFWNISGRHDHVNHVLTQQPG